VFLLSLLSNISLEKAGSLFSQYAFSTLATVQFRLFTIDKCDK